MSHCHYTANATSRPASDLHPVIPKFNNIMVPDRLIKNKSKRPISSVKKQVSTPIRPTIKILTKKKNTYTEEKSYICTMSQNSLMSNKCDKIRRTNHPTTSSIPRSSQSELRKHLIDRSDNLTKKSYQTLFKELEDRYKDVTIELEKSKQIVESLQEQLNKNKDDKEIQTCGISLEQLETSLEQSEISLKNLTSEKSLLNLELKNTKRDLDVKIEDLLAISEQNSTLNSKIEFLNKKVDDLEKINSEKTMRIENLFNERNKLKNNFVEVSRERDLFQEEIIGLNNKYTKTNQKLLELRSDVGQKRSEFVQRSMLLSDQSDLNIKQQKQIRLKEEIILELESMVKRLTLENQDYAIIIDRLKNDSIELKKVIQAWETRAGCWINTFVREEFESKIENLNKEIQQLSVKNLQLTETYNKIISEKCEQISEKERIVEMKQSTIEQMTEIINLMRKTNIHNSDNEQFTGTETD
ncbi:structural maintenance of chromosomes protein 3 homolog [Rhopalosiphum maidis]|uniref:structural maintenance of chromosomes protein 3 homolog n=1 Tax=Rhopalosiphum maidis TaxID=43146 RepID=UPI000F00BAF5|nr:structural maintenance of chromosomes protein 3 homolog [Rhopalosiphum maidis]